MERVHLDKDVKPLSEFRANAASMIERIKSERRPLLLTQHGKSSAVLIDVSEYEKMIDTIEQLKEINQARQEIEDGQGIAHQEVIRSLKERLPQ